jgi:hypothetical protein
VLPGDDEGNDEVRGGEASKMVVAAAWITCRWVARAPPELADAAASVRAIWWRAGLTETMTPSNKQARLSAAQRGATVVFRVRAVAGSGRLRRLGRIVSRWPIFLFFCKAIFLLLF